MNNRVYIDKETLLDEFHSLCGPQTGDGWDNWGVQGLIERQKPANVKPVVKGEWGKPIWGRDYRDLPIIIGSECSICHEKSKFQTHFCPNCGAEMR